jgi:Ca2+-binding RTX toxin-like protein
MARVGYYDSLLGEGGAYQIDEIEAAGHTAVKIEDLSATELAGVDVLYVLNPSNSGWATEFSQALPQLTSAVENGLHLFVADRRVTEAADILPGGADISFVRAPGLRDVHLDENVPDIFLQGPGGPITETTYDDGTSSGHGYATRDSLPAGAVPIFTYPNADHILSFAYPLGQGTVYYTGIPLDFYSETSLGTIKPFEVTLLLASVIDGLANGGVVAGELHEGTSGADTLTGDGGPDTLRGLDGDDTLIGLNGRDLLDGGAGVDRMEGGASDDRYIVDNAADLIVELLGGGARDLAEASVDYTLPDHVERLLLSGTGDLNGTGNAGHNVLIGNAGDNHLQGLAGDDWLDAGPGGDDTLDGGAGTDMASFWQVPPAAQVWQTTLDLDLATGMATAQADSFELIGIENVTGTSGRDILRGDGGDNLLRGLTGDDWLQGRGGNDTLEGGNGIDTASYANAAARLVADLGAGVVRSGTDEDQLISIEGLRASRFSDVITTGNGPTYVSAKEGHDWIVAGYGVDVIDGGRHIDTVSYAGANLGISASLKNGRGWTGAATGDRYAGVENLTGTGYGDALSGDDGRNHLRGLDGNDALFGYGGHDVLIGGTGDDMLFGGNGTDRAVFAGDLADYTITRTSAREITVVGADGTDQLDSVEYLQFDDTTARIWDLEIV